jgi:hypothetical protein
MKSSGNRSNSSLLPWSRVLIVASLILALSLLAAATLPSSAPATSPEAAPYEAEAFAEEEGEEEESEGEEEAEEDEEEEFEAGHWVPLPAECILHSAEPSVAVQLNHGDVRLTLRYTAEESTPADVDLWLKGGKGSLQLGSVSRHLGEHGVIRLTSHPDEREMAKVRAARAFLVNLDLPGIPSHCNRYLTLRLTAKHQLDSRETWSLPLERRRG